LRFLDRIAIKEAQVFKMRVHCGTGKPVPLSKTRQIRGFFPIRYAQGQNDNLWAAAPE
jgi:hypothetical protein